MLFCHSYLSMLYSGRRVRFSGSSYSAVLHTDDEHRSSFHLLQERDHCMSDINFQTVPVKGVSITFMSDIGRFVYRTDKPVTGRGYNISSSVDLEPFSRLRTSFTWTTASLKDKVTGKSFFNGHILRNITSFQFTRFLFLRNILQYNNFTKTFNIYPLITYKFNAFTMFNAGLTRDLVSYETEGYSLRTTGYQYFIKLQYLFQ